MDLTFKTDNGIFNYRVSAVILRDNKLLVIKDDISYHYYLPGGRVKYDESCEEAMLREIKEEIGADAKLIRPLWFAQLFFDLDTDSNAHFHEISVYYLVDLPDEVFADFNTKYNGIETNKKEIFSWIDINLLENEYFYPLFIKDKIHNLPEHPEFITCREEK